MSVNYLDILKKYWGFDEFRPVQEEIIRSVVEGNDTLGLLPTGGGKSLTFQVSAMAVPGLCLVVTPLIALMKDQVENLTKIGIKAYAIHSGLSFMEIQTTLDNCIYSDCKFLYLSPERLSTTLFLEKLPHLNINLIAVDEAHCISQWGYDFRPSYLKIVAIREFLPGVPVLALTATATPKVVKDIQLQLNFRKKNVFSGNFERSNLAYVVRRTENKEEQLLKILNSLAGSAIVYVRSRKKSSEYAKMLFEKGMSAEYFHAGLSQNIKDLRQDRWMSGQTRIIVATNAFGMGIDKSDVRLVIHMDVPDSLEAYFQEAGRAGRDGKRAYSVLLWSPNDKIQLKKGVSTSYPDKETILRIYEALGNFFQIAVGSGEDMVFDFNIGKFCTAYHFNILTVFNSLKILQRAEYIAFSEEADILSRVRVLMDKFELYKFQVANASLDEYIKVLLRSYTGLYTEYVTIDEERLAKRINVERTKVYEAFLALNRAGVLHYIPQRRTALITFLQRREETRFVVIPPEVYSKRKKQYQARINSVIEYLTTQHICRSRLLLRYFGQNKSSNCGICDVCLAKKSRSLSSKEFNILEEFVKDQLQKDSFSAKELVEMSGSPEDKVWKVIHWLEDSGAIIADEKGILSWKISDKGNKNEHTDFS